MNMPPASDRVTRLCICWRIARSDGIVLGFTTHDRNLTIVGVTYEANPGMTPSAIVGSASFTSSQMAVLGTLSSDRIASRDLQLGLWDNAVMSIFACAWDAPEESVIPLCEGRIGEVRQEILARSGRFQADVLAPDPTYGLRQSVRCSPLCRASLGDDACGVDMSGRYADVRVTPVSDLRLRPAQPLEAPQNYVLGRLRVRSGSLCGVDRIVEQVEDGDLILGAPLPDAGPFLHARVWEGCAKTLEDCRTRFANARNFQGEPFVPGSDALLRYAD